MSCKVDGRGSPVELLRAFGESHRTVSSLKIRSGVPQRGIQELDLGWPATSGGRAGRVCGLI